MTIEFILTCGFLSLGGLLLLAFFSRPDILFILGALLTAMGLVPLVVYWYRCLSRISHDYFEDNTDSINEEDSHENT